MKQLQAINFLLLAICLFPGRFVGASETLSDLLKNTQNKQPVSLEYKIHEQLPSYFFTLDVNRNADLTTGESVDPTIEQIDISTSQSNGVIQTLKVSQPIPLADFDFYFAVEDVNFDVYQDISLISSWGATGNTSYNYWLFNPQSGQFEYHEQLSQLVSPYADPNTKTITSFWMGGRMGSIYEELTFRFEGNELKLIRQESQDWIEDNNHFLKVIKELRNGQLETISQEIVNEEDA